MSSVEDLTKRIEAMEGLVGERDARIAVLEGKLASVQAEISKSESTPAAPAAKEGAPKPAAAAAAAATNGSKGGGKKESDGGKAKSGAKPKPEIGKEAAGSFPRLEALRANELAMQASWASEGTFQGEPLYNEDGSPKPKFMATFPYPYMNGRLHLGHAFSLTKAEFCANYKRLKGFNVLFPFGFHCTGMPIQAAANKLSAEIAKYGNPPVFPVEEEDKAAAATAGSGKGKAGKGKVAAKMVSKHQWETLEMMNIPSADVPGFADPITWLRYFPDWGIKDLKGFGTSVDWRRSFITTSINPYYNAFIEWQFRVLRQNDKIVFGKRAGVYSPLDGQVCADHDRAEGEGVAPQEYTLVKLRVQEPFTGKLAALPAGTPVFLTPATLRPETMYGQTNCFVLPEGVYGCYKWANGEVYVMSARAAKGLAHQSAKNVDYSPTWGQTECLLELTGQDLLGTPLSAPRSVYSTIYVLPLMSISMGKGTGVVTSVPSDAPDDYVALAELKAKPEYRKKFGLTDDMVMPFDVVPIINITVPDGTSGEAGWSSDVAAALWCEKLGIKSTKERAKLDEGKHKTYNAGFSFGVMLVGPYKGEKVSLAKPKEKTDMAEAGDALIYYEPEGFVKSRTGEECVVAMTDQWYLKYGDATWRDQVLDHVNDPSKFTPYSQEILDKFNFTLGWLNEWACSRLFGLGTQLPWDPKWVIESLSDSTIYMAFYTIAHMLQGEENLDGTRKPSPCGIAPEQLNDAVFNFIFLRGPECAETASVPIATLEKLRAEFEYWYPMDLRVSGKDLIGNHLTMALYNHAAVWHERPELWPRGYYTNGHVNLNNEKMSKSTGNFLMLEEAVEKFSADATRLALGMAGDTLENANFETDTANAATSMLFLEDKFVAEMVADQAAGKLRTGELLKMDYNVLNETNRLLVETEQCFEKMLWRDGLNAGSAQLRLLRDFYREWCGRSAVAMHEEVVQRYVDVSTMVLAPVCPHYAERVWREHLKRSGSILKAGTWPQRTAAVDAKASREMRFLQKTVKNLRAACAKDKTKAPTQGRIYIADSYNDWKVKTLVFMQTLWKAEKGSTDPNAGTLPGKKELMGALTSGLLDADPSMAKLKKDVMQFAAYVADEAAEGLGLAALDTTMPFDQFEVLAESREYLSKHLVIGRVLELELFNLSAGDVPGDEKKKNLAEPGKPSMMLL